MPRRTIVDYYTDAGPDYGLWSKHFNMHFGFYRSGMNPLDLEGMLAQMNREVLDRLDLDSAAGGHILDLGCGLGATARFAAKTMPNVRVSGVTIVPWQVEQAAALNRGAETNGRVNVVHGDYTAVPFAAGTFDGAYALESSCYAPGFGKEPLIDEAYRILKPGARFVVADAFLKTERWMDPFSRACYAALCRCWSLENLGEIHRFVAHLEGVGFGDIRVVNISRNVTPSVLHIPRPVVAFLLRQLTRPEPTRAARQWGNMLAGPLLIGFALDRTRSGYFLVSCAKG
jgi:SAM-dependent methyltransferase